jgi:hypothetical protein
MWCLKAFGERIAARHPDSQTAEIQIRVALMNRFSALGTAEIVRVALSSRGKGQSCLRRDLRNDAQGGRDEFVGHFGDLRPSTAIIARAAKTYQ